MLDEAPQATNNDGTKELASKQHAMWIAELLENIWSDSVIVEMIFFGDNTKGDGILQFYVFLHENIGHTKEAIIAASHTSHNSQGDTPLYTSDTTTTPRTQTTTSSVDMTIQQLEPSDTQEGTNSALQSPRIAPTNHPTPRPG